MENSLAQTADWALAEEDYWAAEVHRLATEYFRDEPPCLIIRWPTLLPLAARRRLIRHAIEVVRGNLRQVTFEHIEAILRLQSGRASVPGLWVEKSFDELRLCASVPQVAQFCVPVVPLR